MSDEPAPAPTTPPGLRWQHTWEWKGADFVLVRDREGDEPEHIGRIKKEIRSQTADLPSGWGWSLTCWRPFSEAHALLRSDFVETKQEAAEALLEAWAKEAAWRAEMRRMIETTHGCWSWGFRQHVVHGVPTGPKWVRGGI